MFFCLKQTKSKSTSNVQQHILVKKQQNKMADEIKGLFEEIDRNKDGRISTKELSRMFKNICYIFLWTTNRIVCSNVVCSYKMTHW